jgi:hypothetical protein
MFRNVEHLEVTLLVGLNSATTQPNAVVHMQEFEATASIRK